MNKKDLFIKERLQKDKNISNQCNYVFNNFKGGDYMENREKKVIKISLGNFMAIAASVVIVGVLGVSLYAKSKGKPNIISSLQAINKKEPEENVDEIAKELFEKGASKIRELEVSSLDDIYEIALPREEKEYNGVTYIKTNKKYSNVEKEYGEIFTDIALQNILNKRFLNVNGDLYMTYGGATGWDIKDLTVEKINTNDTEITYKAKFRNIYIDDSVSDKKTCEFKIKKINGEYRISETNYLNLDKSKDIEDIVLNDNKNFKAYYNNSYKTEEVRIYDDNTITISFSSKINNFEKTMGVIEAGKEYTINGIPNGGKITNVSIVQASNQTYDAPYIFITYSSDMYLTYYIDTVTGIKTGKFEAKFLDKGEFSAKFISIGSLLEEEQGGEFYEGPELISIRTGKTYHVIRRDNGNIELEEHVNKENIQTSENTGNTNITEAVETSSINNSEMQRILDKGNTKFCIENIEKSGNEYIITANALEKQPKVVTKDEYNEIITGKKFVFRNLEWLLVASPSDENVVTIKSGTSLLTVFYDKATNQGYIENVAGAKTGGLCDCSRESFRFKVSKDILIGGYWVDFKYDENGQIKAYELGTQKSITNFKSMTFEELLDASKGCKGTGEECIAYLMNGNVDAIKIFDK